MVSDLERLRFLGVDPSRLEEAPDTPSWAAQRERVAYCETTRRGCCSCRALAVATRIVEIPGIGLRWHDQCRDCMVAGARLDWEAGTPMKGRYRVTVTVDGKPVVQGWWDEQAIAEDKYTCWIGRHGGRPGARIALTDEETDHTISWPQQL